MEKTGTSDGFIISDAITDLGDRFPLKELLALEYFIKYRSDAPKTARPDPTAANSSVGEVEKRE